MQAKTAAILLALAPLTASATPNPATHVRDQFIAASPGSYVVMRHEAFYPGSYYAYVTRQSVLRLSAWTNVVQDGCVLSEVHWTTDFRDDGDVWVQAPKTVPECNVDDILRADGYGPAMPFPWGVHRQTPIVGALSQTYIETRFENAATDWVDPTKGYRFKWVAGECAFLDQIERADQIDWIFQPVRCGSTDGDVDTVQVFIPVSKATWEKGQ